MPGTPIRVLELRSVRGTGGGPDKTILAAAAHADPARFHVTVCYLRDRRDDVFALDRMAARLGVDYVEVHERHSFDPRVWPQLRRLVRTRGIDIIHSHEYKTDLLALLVARAERIIPLSTVHGWSGWSLRERAVYYPIDRRLLRHFAHVIAVSHPLCDALRRAGVPSERLSLVVNGIDPHMYRRHPGSVARARAALGLPMSTPIVGAVGRLEQEKRFDVLLDAVAMLRRDRDVRLIIGGEGSLRASLHRHAALRGVSDACTFAGHLRDVSTIFHAVDVLVQSSDNEESPNAILEAMASETPIVATDVGGTRDLAADAIHGLLVPRRDPARLASAIAATLDDAPATRGRVAAARRRVEDELSFDTRMRRVEAIYESLAGAHLVAQADEAVVA